jgi:membrane protein DedA with SNARE-associated domain
MWWLYPVVFLAALGVDLIPVFSPPAWTIMVVLMAKFDLNPWGVLLAGVPGSALGRYLFSLYVPKLSDRILKRHKKEDLEFVGKKLGQKLWRSWTFVFLYTLTPLSTTALFTAAAMAKVKPSHTVPPFFAGKFLSDALMILLGHYATSGSDGILESLFSPKGIIMAVFGLVIIFGMLFIDWRIWLQKKKFKLNFKIWK